MSNRGISTLLTRLSRVRQMGPDSWVALCPAHDDNRPSLAISVKDDGRVLMYCRSRQCDVEDITSALGLDMTALFPERAISHHITPQRPRWPASSLLNLAGREAIVVGIGALMLANGEAMTEIDRQRVVDAAARLLRIADEAG